jgi:hypothetical protein
MACTMAGEPATTYAAAAVTPRPTHIQPRSGPAEDPDPFGHVGSNTGSPCHGETLMGIGSSASCSE